tara:strand:+ start:1603 stop:3432 length:1830 start_codon:yes stop_codon:yes gene_type:complete
MKNNFKKIIGIILILSISLNQNTLSLKPKLTKQESAMLKQAKAMEKAGLINESIDIYLDMLRTSPGLKEAFIPLKKIYIRKQEIDALLVETKKYATANKNKASSKLDIFDIYLIADNEEWQNILNDFYNKKDINLNYMKKLISILLSNNKKEIAQSWVKKIREKTKKNSFYSLEMGMHHSMKLEYDKATDEYLNYLKYNPKNLSLISQRIMLLTDYDNSIQIIKNKLTESELIESKIILSKLEFKLKNYMQSYDILKNLSKSDKHKLDLLEDLMKINQLDLAQVIVNDLIKSSNNKNIINESIYQLANIYESQVTQSLKNFRISNEIYKNELLISPFSELNEEYGDLILKAITIYDSLNTKQKDYKSGFQLAEIKYKIQKDFDGAEPMYENILERYSSSKYKKKCLNEIININLSRGDLKKTLEKINSLYEYKDFNYLLDIKKIQSYFYEMQRDSVLFYSDKVLKNISREEKYYNDILKISSLFQLYSDDDIVNYSKAKFELFKNKNQAAIKILNSFEIENPLFKTAQFESIFLEVKSGNYNNAIEKIKKIKENNNYYNHEIQILEAEIYDYGLDDKIKAVDIYLNFLDNFPKSIFYDLIRTRLRELST